MNKKKLKWNAKRNIIEKKKGEEEEEKLFIYLFIFS
jgi:hypothetical protein